MCQRGCAAASGSATPAAALTWTLADSVAAPTIRSQRSRTSAENGSESGRSGERATLKGSALRGPRRRQDEPKAGAARPAFIHELRESNTPGARVGSKELTAKRIEPYSEIQATSAMSAQPTIRFAPHRYQRAGIR